MVNSASYQVTNGKSIIPLKDLGIGQHRLYFKYTETEGSYQREVDDYFEYTECYVNICPVIVPKYVWNETDLIIKFSTPEGVNGNVSVYKNHIGTYDDGGSTYDEKGEWIANATISDGQINLGRFENGYHKYGLFLLMKLVMRFILMYYIIILNLK